MSIKLQKYPSVCYLYRSSTNKPPITTPIRMEPVAITSTSTVSYTGTSKGTNVKCYGTEPPALEGSGRPPDPTNTATLSMKWNTN